MAGESAGMIDLHETIAAVESPMAQEPYPAEVPAEADLESPGDTVAWKQQVLADFAQWLEALPAAEPPFETDGDPTSSSGDLLTLIGETTALRQEVKFMGRNAGKMLGTVEQIAAEMTENVLPLVDNQRRQEREVRQAETRNLLRPLLLEMGDLQEAIREASQQLVDPRWPWVVPQRIRRLAGVARHRSMYDMLVRRIDSILMRHDVKPVAAVRDAFDATVMTAAGISREGAVAAGHVSAIVKQGFTVSGDVLRPAHVIVEEEQEKKS